MRYIKLFEEHQEVPQHLQDKINAALIELEDSGFQVDKVLSLSDNKMVSQEVAVRIQKVIPYKLNNEFQYSEVKEVVSTFIDYIEEIWGYVNINWRAYGYPDPNYTLRPKNFYNEPNDDTYISDLQIRLKNHN